MALIVLSDIGGCLFKIGVKHGIDTFISMKNEQPEALAEFCGFNLDDLLSIDDESLENFASFLMDVVLDRDFIPQTNVMQVVELLEEHRHDENAFGYECDHAHIAWVWAQMTVELLRAGCELDISKLHSVLDIAASMCVWLEQRYEHTPGISLRRYVELAGKSSCHELFSFLSIVTALGQESVMVSLFEKSVDVVKQWFADDLIDRSHSYESESPLHFSNFILSSPDQSSYTLDFLFAKIVVPKLVENAGFFDLCKEFCVSLWKLVHKCTNPDEMIDQIDDDEFNMSAAEYLIKNLGFETHIAVFLGFPFITSSMLEHAFEASKIALLEWKYSWGIDNILLENVLFRYLYLQNGKSCLFSDVCTLVGKQCLPIMITSGLSNNEYDTENDWLYTYAKKLLLSDTAPMHALVKEFSSLFCKDVVVPEEKKCALRRNGN